MVPVFFHLLLRIKVHNIFSAACCVTCKISTKVHPDVLLIYHKNTYETFFLTFLGTS